MEAVDMNDQDFMPMLLTGEDEPFATLELDSSSGLLVEDNLFEACNLEAVLPELHFDDSCLPKSEWQQAFDSGQEPVVAGLRQETGTGSKDSRTSAGQLPHCMAHSQQNSDTDTHSGLGTDAADSSGKSSQDPYGMTPPATEADQKRQARLQRNRENAQASRQRKKAAVMGLEQRCGELQACNTQLTGLVTRLTAEVTTLRLQLSAMCRQTGRPMPVVASALGSLCGPNAAAALQGLSLPQPRVAPAAFGAQGTPQLPVPVSSSSLPAAGAVPGTTRTPAQHSVAHAPAPAPVLVPPQAATAAFNRIAPQQAAAAAAAGNSRKRARTAAGSAFLALFALFMFVGPFGSPANSPLWQSPGGPSTSVQHATLAALPAVSDSLVGEERHAGRALLQLASAPDAEGSLLGYGVEQGGPSTGSDGLLREQERSGEVSGSAQQGDQGISSSQLALLWNSTLSALWPSRQPLTTQQLEEQALRQLQDLAPLALLLDEQRPSATPGADRALAVSHSFPQLAGQMFAASGLRAPQTCHPVFELDAASLPAGARSRRSIERLLLRTLGMRGRSALPPLRAAPAEAEGRNVEDLNASVLAALPSGKELAQRQQEQDEQQHGHGWKESSENFEAGHSEGAAKCEGEWVEEEGRVQERVQQVRSGGSSWSKKQAGKGGGLRLAAADDDAPALVSILVPASNASDEQGDSEEGHGGDGGGLLASLSKVFVVMLHPRQRYVIYACSLHSAMLP